MDRNLQSTLRRLFRPPDVSVSALDYIWAFGRMQDALLYSVLYVPSFVDVEDSILFDRGDETWVKDFALAKKAGTKPLWVLERDFNYVEISHLFNPPQSTGVIASDHLALTGQVAEAWKARLTLLYPKRRFDLSVVGPEESADLYGLRFYEIR